jgi:hypothetical protein
MLTNLFNLLLDRFYGHEWQEYRTAEQCRLVSGGFGTGLLMRRRTGGAWQFREMTSEEATEAEWNWAIK